MTAHLCPQWVKNVTSVQWFKCVLQFLSAFLFIKCIKCTFEKKKNTVSVEPLNFLSFSQACGGTGVIFRWLT